MEYNIIVGFIEQYRGVIEKALLFVTILLLTGIFAKSLFRKLVYAIDPSAEREKTFNIQERKTRILIAVFDLTAWLFSFVIASEVIELKWFVNILGVMVNILDVMIKLISYLINGVFLVVCAVIVGVVVYSFSKDGNELILSLIGYFYLKNKKKNIYKNRDFDLGNGRRGIIEEISLLHTTFNLKDGEKLIKPNAYLMREYIGLARKTL